MNVDERDSTAGNGGIVGEARRLAVVLLRVRSVVLNVGRGSDDVLRDGAPVGNADGGADCDGVVELQRQCG
jgi:hypothetical protein